MLSEAVPQPAVGSSELPTVGSQAHRWGTCSPCAYAHSSRGCKNDVECPFCHLCDPGELKRRQKLKRMTQRRQAAAGAGQETGNLCCDSIPKNLLAQMMGRRSR